MSTVLFAAGAEIGRQHFSWITNLPFAAFLITIAIFTGVFPKKWEKLKWHGTISVIVIILSLIGVIYYQAWHILWHSLLECFQFLALIGTLYVVSSSMSVQGDWRATPEVNCYILLIGLLLAPFMGTAGASILLIRFLIVTNTRRKHKVHLVIFFIFLVANIGGLLTALGDPPLYMALLMGVPFMWIPVNMFLPWLYTILVMLSICYLVDLYWYKKESLGDLALDLAEIQPMKRHGFLNFFSVIMVVLTLIFVKVTPVREIILLIIANFAWRIRGAREARKVNDFKWHPFVEVAVVFTAIFASMGFVLSHVQFNVSKFVAAGNQFEPWHFFVIPGILSGVLDNAPTFVVFFQAAKATVQSGIHTIAGAPEDLLYILCIATVFFGPLTYIGNAPNLLVRAIANAMGIKMPSFGRFMLWSVSILVPVLGLVMSIFVLDIHSLKMTAWFVTISLWLWALTVLYRRRKAWLPHAIRRVSSWWQTKRKSFAYIAYQLKTWNSK